MVNDFAFCALALRAMPRSAAPVMMADWMLGISHHVLGNQAMARRYCETALKLEPIQNSSLTRCGYDHRIRAGAASLHSGSI